jgi:NADH/NAD ratio-sensing transcriptional regulator Rex
MFLADVPKTLNKALGIIKTVINKIYDPSQDKITSELANFTRVESNTIITRNLSLLNENGTDTLSYDVIEEILRRLDAIEAKVN